MKPLRLGVVGCGVIGPAHMKPANESDVLELVAVADRIEERAREKAAEHDVPKVYGEGAELIEDPDIDIVALAFPTGERTALALAALARGKHVLVEKPVAMNSGDVEAMIAACGDSLTAATCSCRHRFTPSAEAAAEFYATGALGELRTLHCRELRPAGGRPEKDPPPWRQSFALNGGGILVNWGCYDLDYLLGLTGWSVRPERVLARWWPISPQLSDRVGPASDADSHVTAFVACAGGVSLTYERGEFCPCGWSEALWRIVGTDGALTLRMTAAEEKKVTFHRIDPDEGAVEETVWEGSEGWGSATSTPVVDMAQAILDGREPATSLRRALVVQQITDAIYASAGTGEAAEID